jgi:hypothetical protein
VKHQVHKVKRQPVFPIVLFVTILILFVMLALASIPSDTHFGQNDFREYWSAFRLMLSGKNPYDPLVMKEFQYEFLAKESPLMMWNPPWLLLFMAPFLCFSFASASMLWIAWSILMLLISSLISIKVIERGLALPVSNKAITGILISSLLFTPVYNGVYLGQISCFLLMGASLFYFGISRGNLLWVVAGAMILSVKPHIFVYAGIIVFWWMLLMNKWRDLFVLLISMMGMVLLTECLFPDSIPWWLGSFSEETSEIAPHPYQWVGPTFGGALRHYVSEVFFEFNYFFVLFMGFLTVLILQKKKVKVDWVYCFPIFMAISVFLSPFGWFFDQTVLLPLYVLLNIFCIIHKRWLLFSFLVVFQLFSHGYAYFWASYHVEMFWFVPGLLFFWILAFRGSRMPAELK